MAVQIMKIAKYNNKEVTFDEFKEIFEHPMVKDRKIVVLSVVGTYRKGKSFFLNYCLKYLYYNYTSIKNEKQPISRPTGWMGMDKEALEGFSWRGGSVLDTKGITFWNDVFVDPVNDIAIVVADTQGLFSNELSQTDNSKIFALGIMISSVLVLNLSGVVQEDQLQYLQHATELAKFTLNYKESDEKPFNKLAFLIRDWDIPNDYPFGIEGGKMYLEYFLDKDKSQRNELNSVCEFLHNSFETLECSLLPNPGKLVTGGAKKADKPYDGSWGEMDEDFRDELFKFIEYLLKSENIIPKIFNGKCLIGSDFVNFIDQCFTSILSSSIPKVKSNYESSIEKKMTAIIHFCLDNYKKSFYECKLDEVDLSEVSNYYQNYKESSLILFEESIKKENIDCQEHIKFENLLVEQIENDYEQFIQQREQKEKRIKEELQKIKNDLEEKYSREREKIKEETRMFREQEERKILKLKEEIELVKQSKRKEVERIKIQNTQMAHENKIIQTYDETQQEEANIQEQKKELKLTEYEHTSGEYKKAFEPSNEIRTVSFDNFEKFETVKNELNKKYLDKIEQIELENRLMKGREKQLFEKFQLEISAKEKENENLKVRLEQMTHKLEFEKNQLTFQHQNMLYNYQSNHKIVMSENMLTNSTPSSNTKTVLDNLEEEESKHFQKFRTLKSKANDLEEENDNLKKENNSLKKENTSLKDKLKKAECLIDELVQTNVKSKSTKSKKSESWYSSNWGISNGIEEMPTRAYNMLEQTDERNDNEYSKYNPLNILYRNKSKK